MLCASRRDVHLSSWDGAQTEGTRTGLLQSNCEEECSLWFLNHTTHLSFIQMLEPIEESGKHFPQMMGLDFAEYA